MPFIPTTNCAKVAIEGIWSGQKVVQTLWFQMNAAPAQSDLQNIADHVGSTFIPALLTSLSSSYALQRVTATRQNSANDIQAVYTPSSPVPGSGGTSLPLNATWAMTYRTALRGRNYRGRGYMPGLLQSIQTSPGAGNLTTLAGIASVYVGNLITTLMIEWTWVVVSHYVNKAARSLGLATPITGVTVDSNIDSQRRRLIGRGQ